MGGCNVITHSHTQDEIYMSRFEKAKSKCQLKVGQVRRLVSYVCMHCISILYICAVCLDCVSRLYVCM